MGSFGERLQREREMRGITLEEIAEATKIGTRSLRALEEQNFDQLPGGIFNKGFVRAYARYLGLDEEQAVADYLGALNEAIAAGKATRQELTANATTPERILINEDEESEPLRLPLGAIAVVVVIAVALFGGWRYYKKNGMPKLRPVRAASQQQKPAAQTMAAAAPDSSPSGQNPVQPAATPASTPVAEAFEVRVKGKEDSWISITADGKLVMEGTLPGASEKSIRAQRTVVVKAGNAAAIELFHNDKLLPPLGNAGQVRTVEFTAAGLRQ